MLKIVFIIIIFQISYDFINLIEVSWQNNMGISAYQIGGNVNFHNEGKYFLHFPVSELVFPVNYKSLNLGLRFCYPGKRIQLYFNGSSTFGNQYLGKLEDSDWINSTDKKDIFSVSDTHGCLDSFIIGASVLIDQHNFFYSKLYTGIEIQYSKQYFIASNLYQYSPSDLDSTPISFKGNVLTFKRETMIPYIVLQSVHCMPSIFLLSQGQVHFFYKYSPLTKITDRDDHILRKKLSIGESIGRSQLWGFRYRVFVYDNYQINIEYSEEDMMTYGTQKQSRYESTLEGNAGKIADTDLKVYAKNKKMFFF